MCPHYEELIFSFDYRKRHDASSQATSSPPGGVPVMELHDNNAYGKIDGPTANSPGYTEIDDLGPRSLSGNGTATDPSYYTEIDDCSPATDTDDDHVYYS